MWNDCFAVGWLYCWNMALINNTQENIKLNVSSISANTFFWRRAGKNHEKAFLFSAAAHFCLHMSQPAESFMKILLILMCSCLSTRRCMRHHQKSLVMISIYDSKLLKSSRSSKTACEHFFYCFDTFMFRFRAAPEIWLFKLHKNGNVPTRSIMDVWDLWHHSENGLNKYPMDLISYFNNLNTLLLSPSFPLHPRSPDWYIKLSLFPILRTRKTRNLLGVMHDSY